MRKKKAVERKGKKEIKGGIPFGDAAKRGFLPEKKLYDLAYKDLTVNKIPDLIHDYQKDENYLSDKIEKYKKEKENLDKNRHDVREEELKFENLENKRLFDNRKNDLRWMNFYSGIAGATFENFKQLGNLGKDVVGSGFTFLGFAGNGVILRVILIFAALALIIGLGLASMYSPQFNDSKNSINAKMNELINPDFENYLKVPDKFQWFRDMMKNLQNLIPCSLRYKFNSFTNSVSYITTGKNQYENYLIDREMITTGRSDNIMHMRFNNLQGFQKEQTYCVLKPKDILLNFNNNLYPSSDYNQLDQSLREHLKYPDSYTVPIGTDKSGRYSLDIDNSYYIQDNIPLTDKKKYEYLPKLFKKDKNRIVLNEVTLTAFNPLSGVIGIYGVTLLNKKHKDPIMVINDFNQHNSNIQFKTSLYYGDEKTYKYYDQNNILQNFNFDKTKADGTKREYYDIEMLLDQSGNNRHFVWKQNDNKYRPVLVKKNNEFAIQFESRSILYQNIPISSPKMFIKSTIMVNNGTTADDFAIIERFFRLLQNMFDTERNKLLEIIKNTRSSNVNDLEKNIKADQDYGLIRYRKYIKIGFNDRQEDIPITVGKDELIRIIKADETKIKKEYEITQQLYTKIINNPSFVAFRKINNFMDFLSTSTTSAVKINFINNDNKNQYNVKIDSIFNDPSNPDVNKEYESIKYTVNEKNTIMTNLDNGRIETIGCILDPRTDKDKSVDIGGKRLGELITDHNFIGYLYDLYIYDRTKMQ